MRGMDFEVRGSLSAMPSWRMKMLRMAVRPIFTWTEFLLLPAQRSSREEQGAKGRGGNETFSWCMPVPVLGMW